MHSDSIQVSYESRPALPHDKARAEKQFLEELRRDYFGGYVTEWPYLTSEVELRAKWRTLQFLKHEKRMSFDEFIKVKISVQNSKADRTPGYPWNYMAPKLYSYWKTLYDSDERAPVELSPYLKH